MEEGNIPLPDLDVDISTMIDLWMQDPIFNTTFEKQIEQEQDIELQFLQEQTMLPADAAEIARIQFDNLSNYIIDNDVPLELDLVNDRLGKSPLLFVELVNYRKQAISFHKSALFHDGHILQPFRSTRVRLPIGLFVPVTGDRRYWRLELDTISRRDPYLVKKIDEIKSNNPPRGITTSMYEKVNLEPLLDMDPTYRYDQHAPMVYYFSTKDIVDDFLIRTRTIQHGNFNDPQRLANIQKFLKPDYDVAAINFGLVYGDHIHEPRDITYYKDSLKLGNYIDYEKEIRKEWNYITLQFYGGKQLNFPLHIYDYTRETTRFTNNILWKDTGVTLSSSLEHLLPVTNYKDLLYLVLEPLVYPQYFSSTRQISMVYVRLDQLFINIKSFLTKGYEYYATNIKQYTFGFSFTEDDQKYRESTRNPPPEIVSNIVQAFTIAKTEAHKQNTHRKIETFGKRVNTPSIAEETLERPVISLESPSPIEKQLPLPSIEEEEQILKYPGIIPASQVSPPKIPSIDVQGEESNSQFPDIYRTYQLSPQPAPLLTPRDTEITSKRKRSQLRGNLLPRQLFETNPEKEEVKVVSPPPSLYTIEEEYPQVASPVVGGGKEEEEELAQEEPIDILEITQEAEQVNALQDAGIVADQLQNFANYITTYMSPQSEIYLNRVIQKLQDGSAAVHVEIINYKKHSISLSESKIFKPFRLDSYETSKVVVPLEHFVPLSQDNNYWKMEIPLLKRKQQRGITGVKRRKTRTTGSLPPVVSF